MADVPASPRPRSRMGFTNILLFAAIFMVLFNPGLRTAVATAVGFVLDPIIGFDGRFPVLTIMLAGTVMILATTVMRHFTTDWIETARSQAMMRHFQKEFGAARKENNTYRMKKLQDVQPEIMKKQQEMSTKQLKTMPLTMIVVIPLFAWLFLFISHLDYWWFTAPWNHTVNFLTTEGILFGSSLFPHWILLYLTLSIPVGALAQKAMKYLSWKERWKSRHPNVKE
jgi:uncharacterized membrane protein (DUF106 family)